MEFVAIASTLVSAAGSIQSGKAQKQMYNLQALQTTAQSERKALQYELQANEILQRKRQANAAIAARSFAGGVDAFSGSPDILRSVNDTVAGREFMFALDNANAAMSFGDIEANMLRAAGKQAEKAGYFDAAAKLGMAAAQGMGGKQSPAPIETRTVREWQNFHAINVLAICQPTYRS
jgi:hypothetical protein